MKYTNSLVGDVRQGYNFSGTGWLSPSSISVCRYTHDLAMVSTASSDGNNRRNYLHNQRNGNFNSTQFDRHGIRKDKIGDSTSLKNNINSLDRKEQSCGTDKLNSEERHASSSGNNKYKLSTKKVFNNRTRRALSTSKLILQKQKLLTQEIRVLGQKGQWEKALKVLDDSQKGDIPVPLDAFIMGSAISAMARSGKWEKALEIFNSMGSLGVNPDTVCLNSAIFACSKGGAWREALQLLRNSPKLSICPDVISYNSCIDAAANCEQWEIAAEIFEEMHKMNVRPDLVTYNSVINAYGKGGQWESALSTFDSMNASGIEPDAFSYSAIVFALIKAKQWSKVCTLWAEANRNGVRPDKRFFGMAIVSFIRAGRGDESLNIVKNAPLKVIQSLDAQVFEKAIRACIDTENWSLAIKLLDYANKHSIGSLNCYAACIIACGKGGQIDKAMELLEELELPESRFVPNTLTYTAAISMCAIHGRVDDAFELLARMKDSGHKPDTVAYSAVMDACAKAGLWRRALTVLDEILNAGLRPDSATYATAINACAKTGQYNMAFLLLNEMGYEGIKPDAISYTCAIWACANAEEGAQWERALLLLADMKANMIPIPLIAYNAAILTCARAGQILNAQYLFSDVIESPHILPDVVTYTAAIHACARSTPPNVLWAECLLAEMEKAGGIATPDVGAFGAALATCVAARDVNAARRVLLRMVKTGVLADKGIYKAEAVAESASGELGAAILVLEQMREKKLSPDIDLYQTIIRAFISSKVKDDDNACVR